jgi:membrane protein DedA with SNARE-associated domain/rhodanese-related sulfurtransferase
VFIELAYSFCKEQPDGFSATVEGVDAPPLQDGCNLGCEKRGFPLSDALRLSYPLLWGIVFARQLCLPVPAVLFLMTAGAMAHKGELNLAGVLCTGVLGCLCGDLVWFEAGRFWGSRIIRMLSIFSNNPQRATQRSREIFAQWGIRSLVVSKFVPGLDGITPPLAGMEGTKRSAFLVFDGIGSLLWSVAYAGLGYLFSARLASIAASLGRVGDVIAVVVGVPLLCYILWRAWVLIRMLRFLRMRMISPLLLKSKLDQGVPIAIIDLLNFEEMNGLVAGIPGAVRIDLQRLTSRSHVTIPEDTQIVLYCSSSNAIRSARVAIALRRKGVSSVWILDGGLNGWTAAGLPTTLTLCTERDVADRLGIVIFDQDHRKAVRRSIRKP